jgi:hypothetical protein
MNLTALVRDLRRYAYEDSKVEFLQKWLEQNRTEVVVGLDDFQKGEVANLFAYNEEESMEYQKILGEYLATQTFTQKEVPVGLSDAQVGELAEVVAGVDNVARLENRIRGWLMTQKFAQPSKFLEHLYIAARNELEQIKSQFFQPNWDDAPAWANWLAQDSNGGWYLYENKPVRGVAQWGRCDKRESVPFHVNPNWIETMQERPKPQVEVGQVWKNKLDKECIINVVSIGFIADSSEKSLFANAVSYNFKSSVYTRSLSDFLANFERVQP